MVEKIREVSSLKKFKPVIEIKGVQAQEKSELFDDYIITEEISNNFEKIFEEMTLSISERKRKQGYDINPSAIMRAFLLRGAYGTGKSYFLLTLSTILEEISNGNGEKVKEKFKDFDGIVYQVDKLMEEEKYFVVSINGVSETNVDFEDAIMKNFIEKSQSCFPEDDFVSMSSFENAIKSLEEGKENEDRWNLLSTQLGKMDIDYEQLISGLKKYKRSYLKTYQKLMEKAYGVPISIYNNKFDEFIKESVEYIKNKGYKKIIYIFDEFSTYLESLVEDGRINKNLDKIQELAEACHFSRQNDTVFIASIHKSISILLKSTILEKEKLDKVVGRFNEIPIDFSEGNELIKNTINVNKVNYLFMMNQYDEARHLDNITDGELEYYYPVHPITIKYLNMLSKLYAQENRTLFRFLSDVVDKKIRVEDIILDGKLNIVTMDYLYDYFIETAVQDNLSIISSANDALRFCKEEWQKKVIKSLIVSRIAVYEFQGGHDIKIGLSVENLSDYLLIDDKKILEDFLQGISSKTSVNIYYDKENDVYMFMENTTSKVNLEKEKREIAKTIIEYDEILNLLRTKGKNRDYYNIKVSIQPLVDVTSVKREFQSQVFNNSNIMKMLENKSNLSWSNDGNIVHLLPQYFEVASIDVSSIEKYMKNYGDNIAIAVPKKYDFNRETIIEYAVYKKMLIDEKYLKDEGIKQYLVNEKNKYEDLLIKKIDEYTDIRNFFFVFNSGTCEFDNYEDLFAYMLKKHYFKFPNIKTPIRSERRVTNQIIKTFVAPGEKVIAKSSNAEEDRLIKEVMYSLDLADIKEMPAGNVKAELKIPIKDNNAISHEIFEIVCSNEKNKIFNILENSPYGMPEFLIELYIACAVSLGKIYIYEGEKLLPISPEVVGNIKANEKLEIRKAKDDLDYDELKYAIAFWKVMSKPISSINYKKFNPEKGIKNKLEFMASIAGDNKVFIEKIKSNYNVLMRYGLELKLIQKLYSELEALNEVLEPEKYIKTMNELPSKVFENVDKMRALKMLEDCIEEFMNITDVGNMEKYLKILSSCKYINEKKFRFETNEQLMKQYKAINDLKESFLKDPLNFKKIDKLDKLVKDFFSMFNELYKENHKDLYTKISSEKSTLNTQTEVELVEALENFQFPDINTLKNIHKNIRDMSCTNDFTNGMDSELYNCICMGKDSSINDFGNKYQEFIDEVNESNKALLGAIGAYRKKFFDLDRKNILGKKSLREFIDDKDKNLLKTYMEFMGCLNDDPVRNREFIIKNSPSLSNVVREYRKYVKVTIKGQKAISFKELNEAVNSSLKFSGKARMNKEELLEIVKKTLDEKVGDNIIVIDSND